MRTLPDVVQQLELEGGPVSIDEAGYLTDPDNWSEEFATVAASEEGIEMRDLHWEVIAFMRSYFEEHQIAADARFVMKFLSEKLSTDKAGAREALFDLFPYGYVKQACKMAGMRQPRAWSTG